MAPTVNKTGKTGQMGKEEGSEIPAQGPTRGAITEEQREALAVEIGGHDGGPSFIGPP